MDNLSLFSDAILKVTSYVSQYLDAFSTQFAGQYPKLAGAVNTRKGILTLRLQKFDSLNV